MPQTRRCDFCEADIEPGTGTMFVRTDGTTIHFCSSKCESNADLGREARDLEWAGQEEAQQEDAQEDENGDEPVEETETEAGADGSASTDESEETEAEA